MLRNTVAYALIGIAFLFVAATAYWGYQFIFGSASGAFINQMIALFMVLLFAGLGHKIKESTSETA